MQVWYASIKILFAFQLLVQNTLEEKAATSEDQNQLRSNRRNCVNSSNMFELTSQPNDDCANNVDFQIKKSSERMDEVQTSFELVVHFIFIN